MQFNPTNLKIIRLKKKKTQQQVGDAVGVTKAYISQIEKGIRKGFTYELGFNIAQFLGTTPDKIFLNK